MKEFNKLWAGQTVSLLGTALTMFALPTLAVLGLHASAVQIGALSALETLPFPLLGMFAGVLADRWSRRKIMIAADVIRSLALGAIPLLVVSRRLDMMALYVVAAVTGSAATFFAISYQAYMPVVVASARLNEANQRLEFSNSGSAMAGSALAGLLVQWIGAAAAIAIDAGSYLVSVLSLTRIRVPEVAHDGRPLSLRQAAREMLEGLKLVLDSPDLRFIIAATSTTNFGGGMNSAVSLIFAYRVLHLAPGALGVVSGIAQLGFVGALLSTRVRLRLGLRATLLTMLLINGFGEASVLLAQLGFPLVAVFASVAIGAITVPIYNVNQVSYRQALVDIRKQGRLNATVRTFVWGTLPLGAITGGVLGSLLGPQATIAISATLSTAAALWLVPFRERALPVPPAAATETAAVASSPAGDA
jgi:MFS family permease